MMKRLANFLITVCLVLPTALPSILNAQGLSGPSKRLEETLSGQNSGGSSSRPGPASPQSPGSGQQTGGYPGGSGSRPGPASPQSPGSGQQMSGYPGGSGSRPGPASPGSGGSGYNDSDMEMEMDDYDMEMDMDDYDMEMDGYGGGGIGIPGVGGSGSGGNASGMGMYGGVLASMFGSADLSKLFLPKQDMAVQSGPVLGRDAQSAFQAGHYPMALELMFAHMATEYDDATVAFQNVKFSSLLKRPVWNIRWGVSIAVRGDDVEDNSPIKEGAKPAGGLASRGGGLGEFGGSGGALDFGMDDGSMEMDDFGGEEDQMNMEMEMEGEMGGFGSPGLPGGPGGMSMPGGFGMAGGRNGSPAPTTPSIPERKMLSDAAKAELTDYLGLVETVIAEEFSKRFTQGDFGTLFTTVTPPAAVQKPANNQFNPNVAAAVTTSGPPMSMQLNDALLDAGDPLQPMWLPGIAYIGQVESSEDAISIANEMQLDLILHFDISLKQIRQGLVQNVSRCRLMQVAPATDAQGRKRHLLITSKGMDNLESQQLAATSRQTEREYVDEQLSSLWAFVDREVAVIELPSISSEVAKRRIANLLSGPSSQSLRTLAEARYYQSVNLINESEIEQLFHIAGGEDGLILLHGPRDQRLEVSRQWAVKAASQSE